MIDAIIVGFTIVLLGGIALALAIAVLYGIVYRNIVEDLEIIKLAEEHGLGR